MAKEKTPKKNNNATEDSAHPITLEEWLERHSKNNMLDLEPRQLCDFEIFTTYCYEDPAYHRFVSRFMHDPNLFLTAHPDITKLSLKDDQGNWSPYYEINYLAKNATLTYLNLEGNGLDNEDVNEVAKNTRLKGLSLKNNDLDYQCAEALAKANFVWLNVSRNTLSDKGAAYFINNKILKVLY